MPESEFFRLSLKQYHHLLWLFHSADGEYVVTTMTKASLYYDGIVKWYRLFPLPTIRLLFRGQLCVFFSSSFKPYIYFYQQESAGNIQILLRDRCALFPFRYTNLLHEIWLLVLQRSSSTLYSPVCCIR